MVTRKKTLKETADEALAAASERKKKEVAEAEPKPSFATESEKKFIVGQQGGPAGGRQVSKEEFEKITKGGTRKAPTQKELAKEAISKDPTQFGLLTPEQQQELTPPEGFETIVDEGRPGLGSQILEAGKSQVEGTQVFPQPIADLTGFPGNVDVPIGIKAALAAGAVGWAVGGTTYVSSTKAAQAGVAAKNALASKTLGQKIFNFGVGAYAALKAGEGVLGYFTGRKIDEQQQAVNTLGQMATTIGGASTEATGDWRKGKQELQYLKDQVLYLESAIQAGKIQKAAIKFNGKIYDINADMADQLATIDEQITIIDSFVVTNSFPELDELQAQQILRELELEGIVKPVDLTTSRRPTQ